MIKTMEIEYVGIEDIQDIIDDAYALMKLGHYVTLSLSSIGDPLFYIRIMVGGFSAEKEFDYSFDFRMSDDEYSVTEMEKCRSTINNLLADDAGKEE